MPVTVPIPQSQCYRTAGKLLQGIFIMGFVFLHNGILTVPQELALNPIPRPKVSDFYRRWSVTSFTDLKSQVLSLRENRKSSGKGALPFGQGHTGSFLTRQETLTIRSSSSTQGLPVRITALRGHCLPHNWTYFYPSASFALTSRLLKNHSPQGPLPSRLNIFLLLSTVCSHFSSAQSLDLQDIFFEIHFYSCQTRHTVLL